MRIVLATDGSDSARAACEWLRQFPLPATASVLVATAVTERTSWAPDVRDILRAEARGVAETTRRMLVERWPGTEARVVDGDPRISLLRVAEEVHADLIVVGSRGLGALAGLVLGSVSMSVVRHASCPVLITNGSPRAVRAAVLAIDGSAGALAAARWFAALPLEPGTRVRLLAVVERPRFPSSAPGVIRPQLRAAIDQIVRERTAELEKALTTVEGELDRGAETVERRLVVGHPPDAIVRAAEEAEADLVVVGARGLGALERAALGSVSERVLRRASCPVLVVKGAGVTRPAPAG